MDAANSTIMIIDDNPSNLAVLYTYLTRQGFRVLTADSGKTALDLLNTIEPDLMLLDVLMPGYDGYNICRRIKAMEKFKDTPIIFLTAVSSLDEKLKGFEAGGVDFITKPFDHAELRARINTHLTIRRQRKELEEINQNLAKENLRKDKLFSIISHDIRSPLSTILGYSEILIEDIDELEKNEVKKYSNYINSVANEINNLMTNLLDWSRVQLNKVDYHPAKVSFNKVCEKVKLLFKEAAAMKDIDIRCDVENDLYVFADENMIGTILRNLVSNAVKFTSRGGSVTISARSDEEKIRFSVQDTGIGIAEGEINKLFEIGNNSSRLGTEQERGTGLGLILCREFAAKHNGSIRVSSEVNKGSLFTVTLPAYKEEPAEKAYSVG